MRLAFLFPHMPPSLNGIGDHTTHLIDQIAQAGHSTALVTGMTAAPLEHGETAHLLAPGRPRFGATIEWLVRWRPDWVLLPFEQYAYGPRGVNPYLPAALSRLLGASPTRLALHAHETFAPFAGARSLPFTAIQRLQFRAIARSADVMLLSTEPWVEVYKERYPKKTVRLLPVGSNLPDARQARAVSRQRQQLHNGDQQLVVFGGLEGHRDLPMLRHALAAAPTAAIARHVRVAYCGKDVDVFKAVIAGLDLQSTTFDRASAATVAETIAGSDLALSPFIDGVSQRRGSFLAALQQAVATVTTSGPLTGSTLMDAAARECFSMVESRNTTAFTAATRTLMEGNAMRTIVGERGHEYFNSHHSWPVVAAQVLAALEERS